MSVRWKCPVCGARSERDEKVVVPYCDYHPVRLRREWRAEKASEK